MSAPEPDSGTRVAFGLPGAVSAAMALLIAVYLTKFYVDVVALPAGIMAVAIAAGRAFDANRTIPPGPPNASSIAVLSAQPSANPSCTNSACSSNSRPSQAPEA